MNERDSLKYRERKKPLTTLIVPTIVLPSSIYLLAEWYGSYKMTHHNEM